jgi:cyclophilin family peptidyl-prolyl cis-trans isomerase
MFMAIRIAALLIALLAMPAMASAADSTPAAPVATPKVRFHTNMGDFTMQLDPVRAPLTVANFLQYVRDGYYTKVIFHRVVSGFVVQAGGYQPDFQLKPPRAPIPNESGNGLTNKRGTVGLARTDDPHSGEAQFYVNLTDNDILDPRPNRWGYAVFGAVIDGLDVVDKISNVDTGAGGPFPSEAPLKPVIIEKAEVLN